ncbi:hypothetical protein BH10PSE2_BH10PSE2_14570 [soil metagenome]
MTQIEPLPTAASVSRPSSSRRSSLDVRGPNMRREVIEIVRIVGLALGLSLILRILLFQPFTIPSSSMEPGLVTGDYILVSKFAYGWSRASVPFDPPLFHGRIFGREPARGDVVVFRRPSDPTQTWIKSAVEPCCSTAWPWPRPR